MTGYLRKDSALGKKWCSFLAKALPHTRTNHSSLYAAWPISSIDDNQLNGPLIYAAIARGECLYVGQTTEKLRTRIRRHLRDSKKSAANWTHVLAIELDACVPVGIINDLERRGRIILDPAMGSRWARRKN